MILKRTFDPNMSSKACATPRSVPMISAVVAEGTFRFPLLRGAALGLVTEGDSIDTAIESDNNQQEICYNNDNFQPFLFIKKCLL